MSINRITQRKSKTEQSEGPQRSRTRGLKQRGEMYLDNIETEIYRNQFPTRLQSVWTTLIIGGWTGKR